MSSSLSIFGIGVVLGGAIATLATRFPSPATSHPAFDGAVALPAWNWRSSATPSHLSPNSATAAISGWFSLRGPGGGEPGFAARATSLRALILHLPPEALRPLVEALSRSTRDDDKRLLTIAFNAWVAQDAPSAARWAVARGDSALGLAEEALAEWTAKDPAAAATWACAIPNEETACKLAGAALSALATTDSARALALARSRGAKFRNTVLPIVVAALGQNDPVGTIHAFAPDLWNRGQGFGTLRGAIGAWLKKDPSAALTWLVAQPRQSDRLLSYWIQTLGEGQQASPRAFANAVIANPGLAVRPVVLRDLLFAWSMAKPDEEIAWLNSISDPDLRLNLVAISSNTYRAYNPEKSLPLALAMPEGGNRTERISMLLGEWAKINPTAMLAWTNEHDVPGTDAAVYTAHGALLAEIARDDLQTALSEWAALSDAKARNATIDALATAWGQKDPSAALQWAAAQHDTAKSDGTQAYTQLLAQWSKSEPEAALRWIENWSARQPHPAPPYNLFDSVASDMDGKAPNVSTADLYAKIEDPKLRSAILTRHLDRWLTKDPVGARAWLDSHDALSPTEAAALLNPAK